MVFSLSRVSHATVAALLLLLAQSSTACRCSMPTDTITTHFMQVADAVGRLYVHNSISPITGIDGSLYYSATAYKWFKGDVGLGKMIVKTSVSGSECGASVILRNFSVFFGTVRQEVVPGYAGTVATLTIDSCKPQKVTTAISKTEWATLTNYSKEPVVCAATACDDMKMPVLPNTCPVGTDFTSAAVCQGQDNGSCGWTVTASCKQPDVCVEKHCDGQVQPDLACPAGSVVDTSTFMCEKQKGGSCGWTGSATCRPINTKVAPKVVVPDVVLPVVDDKVCADSDCDGLDKPVLEPLACPKTMVYTPKFTCERQTDSASCGWTATADCAAGVTKGAGLVVCDINDCAAFDKPMLDAPPCPDGEVFADLSACEESPEEPGTCGWNINGECRPKKI
jgi:hypothetical protein